ncbi:MAG: hypothetical protein ACXIUD_13375, partial [Mongoliitalea sp.]
MINFTKYSLKGNVAKLVLSLVLLVATVLSAFSQVRVPFDSRTGVLTPDQSIYSIKGDFTMVGNKNLTLVNYGDNTNNGGNQQMTFVRVDPNTINSSTAELVLANPDEGNSSCSKIVFAGLYWTGRNTRTNNNNFNLTRNGITRTLNSRSVKFKGPGMGNYIDLTADRINNVDQILYPTGSRTSAVNNYNIFVAYKDVTQQLRAIENSLGNASGDYTIADIALEDGADPGSGQGLFGGWGLVVVYENDLMKNRDITIFDGYGFVATNGGGPFNIDINGIQSVQNGPVGIKLGVMAGEGDVSFTGDYFEIRNRNSNSFTRLSHSGNTPNNFFNSSILTNGSRNPNQRNNVGIDIAMFDIPNDNNSIIDNNQTSTRLRYGTDLETYVIFNVSFSVDAYVPELEALNILESISNSPSENVILPGEEATFKVEIRNKGTEPIDNGEVVIPIPFGASFVPNSLIANFNFTPSGNQAPVFDANRGANGAIVWKVGNIPLDENNLNNLLASLSYRLLATTDCRILSNVVCGSQVDVNGFTNGIGSFSQRTFTNKQFVKGFQNDGACADLPITGPITLSIDATNFVSSNCQDSGSESFDFFFCNIDGQNIPVSEIRSNFPAGFRFFNPAGTIEFTNSNPFPASQGIASYRAVASGNENCFFNFTINVSTLTSQPTVTSPLVYCLGEQGLPLTATIVDGDSQASEFSLFFYRSATGGITETEIIPNTDQVGTITYYVAQGLSPDCVGPRVPIEVIILPIPDVPVFEVTPPTCEVPTGAITLTPATGFTYSIDGAPFVENNVFAGLNPGEYQIRAKNESGCISAPLIVVIDPQPETPAAPVVAEVNQPTCEVATGTIRVTEISGVEFSIGGAYQTSGVFASLAPGEYTITARFVDGTCISGGTTATVNAQPETPAAPVVSEVDQPTCEVATGTIRVTEISGVE